MKIKKDDLVEALDKARLFTGDSFAILRKVMIDGPGGRIVATDIETTAEFKVAISDFTREIAGEKDDPVFPDDETRADLMSLKKDQLEGLVAGAQLDVSGKKEDLANAIMDAWQKSAEEIEQQQAPVVTVEERVCVDPVKLLKIVQSLENKGDDLIDLTVSEFTYQEDILSSVQAKSLTIGDHFQKLVVDPSDDFPYVDMEKAGRPVAQIKGSDLGMVAAIAVNSVKEGKRIYHEKILFDAENGFIVSCDGSRIHALKHDLSSEHNLLLPAKAMKSICKIGAKGELQVFASPDGKHVKFAYGNATVIMRNDMESQYPDYMKVLSKDTLHTVTVEKKTLNRVLSQANLISSKSMVVTFNGGINVESNDECGVYNRENIPFTKGKVDPPMRMGLNPQFLVDAIKNLSDSIKIRLTGDGNPVYLSNGKTFQACVMPMRI